MAISNIQIAAIFLEIAESLEVENDNYYRARAYRNAAKVIEKIPQALSDLVIEGKDLTIFPGIGKALAAKIVSIVLTGVLPKQKILEKPLPAIVNELTRIPRLGRKRIRTIFNAYPFTSMEELKELFKSGKVSQLKGFSARLCQEILSSLERISLTPRRLYWFRAENTVTKLLRYLRSYPDIKQAEVAGSFRRKKETVGNINLIVASNEQAAAIRLLIEYPETIQVVERGDTAITVELWSGLLVQMVVTSIENFGTALYYHTGPASHIQELERIARKNGIHFSSKLPGENSIRARTESEFVKALNIEYIPPELREQEGLFQKIHNEPLPDLILLQDILGDLHCHTNSTDGKFPLEDMVAAAQEKGYQYLAITDHSQGLTITNGLDARRLFEQIKLIDKLNAKLTHFTILKSIEVDILADGALDLPNDVLKELDIIVCSVHSKFRLSMKDQTERIILAMDNPYFNILGHATGRLINHREPYEVDIERIIKAQLHIRNQ